jgi:hypothetical protein
MTTHYELLGVVPDASHDEIKRAYHRQARRYHPDARPGADQRVAEQARRIMISLNAAWAVLGEPARRKAYDAEIGVHPGQAEPEPWSAEPDDEFDPLLEDDEDPPPPGPADLIVLVPVCVLALAVGAFAFSTLLQSPFWMWVSIVLLPVAALAFVTAPLAVMLSRARARTRADS